MAKSRVHILSIGGFDPSGGAGVLADAKTFEYHKLQGMAVLTANTIQNDATFLSANCIALEAILEQLDVLKNFPIKAIKIGMVENLDILLSILKKVKEFWPKAPIVWDPVLKATVSNTNLWETKADVLAQIAELVTVLTPNHTEWKSLNPEQEKWPCNIIVSGSDHPTTKGLDTLITPKNTFEVKPLNFKGWDKHGSGCIFSSAIAANIARGYPLLKALQRAKAYTVKCLNSNTSLLAYHK